MSFVSSTELNATLPAELISAPVVATIAVEEVDLMGEGPGPRSNGVAFTVDAP